VLLPLVRPHFGASHSVHAIFGPVSAFSKEGSGVHNAVVVLKSPKLENDRLTFDVDAVRFELTYELSLSEC
jgi:hypothetical protein